MKSKNLTVIIVVVIIVLAALVLWYLTASTNTGLSLGGLFSQSAGQGSAQTTATSTPAVEATGSAHPASSGVPGTGLPAPTRSATSPTITSLSPSYGGSNTLVTIHGTNFSSTTNTILFGGSLGLHQPNGEPDNAVAVKASPDGKTLTFNVPALTPAGTLCNSSGQCSAYSAQTVGKGNYSVVVTNAQGVSEAVTFAVTN